MQLFFLLLEHTICLVVQVLAQRFLPAEDGRPKVSASSLAEEAVT
jgi:hypothetical protein